MTRITYNIHRTPVWIWVLIVLSIILLLLLIITTLQFQKSRQAVVAEPQVNTGDPANYVEGRRITAVPNVPVTPAEPTPSQEVTPAPTTVSPPPPPPPPPPSNSQGGAVQVSAVPPDTISFGGQNWRLAGGPMSAAVVTTGEHVDGQIVYAGQNAKPPYKVLYIETSPNSGKFYKYVPSAK